MMPSDLALFAAAASKMPSTLIVDMQRVLLLPEDVQDFRETIIGSKTNGLTCVSTLSDIGQDEPKDTDGGVVIVCWMMGLIPNGPPEPKKKGKKK